MPVFNVWVNMTGTVPSHCALHGVLLQLLGASLMMLGVPANGELFPISDTTYPHIFISDPATVPVIWHRKSFAFRHVHACLEAAFGYACVPCSLQVR